MKVILVDDERLALDYLERQLAKLAMDINIIGKYTDPLEGRREIIARQADIVFLDINLPELNGIELAEQILEQKLDTQVVFVTAYDEYAVKAFELNALDYIVKPIQAERLAKTMARIKASLDTRSDEAAGSDPEYTRINMFRQVSVEMKEGRQSLLQWRTTRAQELFLYLLQHRGQLVRKSTLAEMFWPEYEHDKVYSQLYTTVYHIRKTLKPFGSRIQIVNTTEGYMMSLDQISLDTEEWEAKLAVLPHASGDSIDDYIDVMKMYAGDYLQEYDYWWAESERQRLKNLWLEASYVIAGWYRDQALWDKAISGYQHVCALYPLEEESHFALMKIYASLNNSAMVEIQYNALETALREELNLRPSSPILDWYEAWKKSEVTAEKQAQPGSF
ncbi:two-component SAPR family response regulator [Fontibacillus phaseoli]|uniref:Two-component SAPR family response regulator n=1 Tax=Fontibacillus phaseoli TaxID=1416533 RepID=A0A369BLB3_9BACL|nr:response regulator [Fontibacillus phaseoli]RCX21408.1 two-component SAPR family response regulator [Fontibacillus phaseoli]